MPNVACTLLKPAQALAIAALLSCCNSALAQSHRITNELGSNVEEPSIGYESNGLEVVTVSARYNDALANTVQSAIDSSRRRTLSTDVHTPWQIMHALLGLRHEFKINNKGKKIDGLGWISDGPKFDGEDWFLTSQWGGKAHPYSKPYAFEGHANQSLAILSMLGLPATHELKAGRKTITIADMINHAKMEINSKEEVSWSLWALSRYLPPDATWTNKTGEIWSVERMAQLQLQRLLSKPMMKHPCGGTHAMFALAHARNIRLQNGLPIRGIWLQVDQQIRKCIELARVQQQRNGQFSTKFFDGRATEADFDKRIASSGHVLEFLMIALPQDQLNLGWVRSGIEATSRDIMANRQSYVKCAPLYHAINGLTIYLDRTQNMAPGRLAARPAALTLPAKAPVKLLQPVTDPEPQEEEEAPAAPAPPTLLAPTVKLVPSPAATTERLGKAPSLPKPIQEAAKQSTGSEDE